MIVPNYAFIDGFYRLSLLTEFPFAQAFVMLRGCDTEMGRTETRSLDLNLIYMAVCIVVYPLLAVAIDTLFVSFRTAIRGGLEPEVQDEDFENDEDVNRIATRRKLWFKMLMVAKTRWYRFEVFARCIVRRINPARLYLKLL